MSETEREPRRFYRVKEAAAIMGVPLRTMYHLAETGQIPCRRRATDLRPRDLPRAQRRGRCLNKLKNWRGIAMRSDKTARGYHAAICLAATLIWIRSDLSNTT